MGSWPGLEEQLVHHVPEHTDGWLDVALNGGFDLLDDARGHGSKGYPSSSSYQSAKAIVAG